MPPLAPSLAAPRSERTHIAFFGRCNAGKSSLLNALTRQPLAAVSDLPGTTTDAVEKSMEIAPIGALTLIDSPGLGDDTALGDVRAAQTEKVLVHTDLAVLVLDSSIGWTSLEESFAAVLRAHHIPFLLAANKCDLPCAPALPEGTVKVSARTGAGLASLLDALGALFAAQEKQSPPRTLFGGFVRTGDTVVLVTPIDAAAPKGRLILPQTQTLRTLLDLHAAAVVVQPPELADALGALSVPPRLVITDSQAFRAVSAAVPENIPLTSFSILFARYKGVLPAMAHAAAVIPSLAAHSRILVAEGCTHRRQCGDIGTQQIPRLLEEKAGKPLSFSFVSGRDFPGDLSPFALVVHCGGCMLNAREMQSRAEAARVQGVPYLNYGFLLAYANGLLARSTRVLEEMGAER